MKRSSGRTLTTHVGSLPRPEDMLETLGAKLRGEPVDEQAFEARLPRAVADSVRQQAEHGLDVINDGEVGKPSFTLYVNERLSGFEQREVEDKDIAKMSHHLAGSREFLAFPDYYQPELLIQRAQTGPRPVRSLCVGPITYKGHGQLQRDITNFKTALAGVKVEEAFLPAAAPHAVAFRRSNEYYRSEEEFELAIAEAMREEYKAIVQAGFVLQVDDPQLVTHYTRNPGLSLGDYRRWAERHIELLNHALHDIPREKIRFHTCYSVAFGPRVHDLELKNVIDLVVKIHAGAHSFEASNPRHEHEWKTWESVKLAADTVLIPGVITQSTVTVEHPELVAERIARFAGIVGRENVIAGVDCGFSSTARSADMPASVVWAKLDALVEGAGIASKRLWG